jgi:hypothetical protein
LTSTGVNFSELVPKRVLFLRSDSLGSAWIKTPHSCIKWLI